MSSTLAASRHPKLTPYPQYVNFFALDGTVDLTVLMGDGPAQLTGGGGGWQEEERWGLQPATWWKAPANYRQTIPILFEGGPFSEETAINALVGLTRPRGSRIPPPPVFVAGSAIHRADLTWVVESVTPGSAVLRRASDGDRTRQDYVVNLLQYSPIDVLVDGSPAQKNAAKQKTPGKRPSVKTWKVRQGDTLPKIAASPKVYGDATQWKKIAHANGIRDSRTLKVGRVLKIPS